MMKKLQRGNMFMREDYYEWLVPSLKNASIGNELRFEAARLEKDRKKPVELEKIIRLVNDFLVSMDLEKISKPKIVFDTEHSDSDRKKKMTKKGVFINLDDERDIVWMKFTKSGYLGTVGTSVDINFSYDNNSGKIIRYLGEEWDESFLLVFPLIKSPRSCNKLDRHLMESGIGNYLISQNVPILDFYSHNI